jgi:hemolysin activation/secretion protein
MKLKKLSCSAIGFAIATLCGAGFAQQASPGAAKRSIEETQSKLPVKPVTKPTAVELMEQPEATPMERMDAVIVTGDKLRAEIEAYWAPLLGKPVSAAQITAFRAWVYDSTRSNGYLAYAQTTAKGNTLEVSLVVPRIQSVKVFAKDQALAKRYLQEVQTRFSADFKPGAPFRLEATANSNSMRASKRIFRKMAAGLFLAGCVGKLHRSTWKVVTSFPWAGSMACAPTRHPTAWVTMA